MELRALPGGSSTPHHRTTADYEFLQFALKSKSILRYACIINRMCATVSPIKTIVLLFVRGCVLDFTAYRLFTTALHPQFGSCVVKHAQGLHGPSCWISRETPFHMDTVCGDMNSYIGWVEYAMAGS